MEQKLNRLLEILGEEVACHAALESDLAAEAARDGEMSGQELLAFQGRKIRTVRQIKDLEIRRQQVVSDLAENWNESAETLDLRRIIRLAPRQLGQALSDRHAELLRLVGDIRELAEITGGNALARLKAIDATLAVVREAMKIHPTYSEEGRLQKRTPTLKSTSA